ncbi:hypothetical protein JOC73_001215 [Alkaliphilus hydrothermalis]|uniref:Uncharacterized protein n=1 Tax=Alkaliphilus hydrothermalis TaxID=1482730 RepID=A0ABS2NP24_9FIRM|nr:hypothetical protein [Alkaliphilus hydrothermalis]
MCYQLEATEDFANALDEKDSLRHFNKLKASSHLLG